MQGLLTEDHSHELILAARLKYFSIALFVAYLLTATTEALPLKFAEVGWQLNLVTTLVDNAPLPLLGLALAHLGAHLVGSSGSIHQYRNRVATLAVIPAIGFLLLAPAQLGIGWNAYLNANQSQVRQLDSAERRLELLSQNIGTAISIDELQSALRAQQGTQLSGSSLDQPLSRIKTLLQGRIHEARQVIRRNRSQLAAAPDPSPLIRRSLRVSLMSLVFSAAYAIGAQRPYSDAPLALAWILALLDALLASLDGLHALGERIERRRNRRRLLRDYRRARKLWALDPLTLAPAVEMQEKDSQA